MTDMTEDNKNTLFGDLCARIRCGVQVDGGSEYGVCTLIGYEYHVFLAETSYGLEVSLECPRPYLRPMESMTEEEQEEFGNLVGLWKYNCGGSIRFVNRIPELSGDFAKTLVSEIIIAKANDWLNKHHFDYRGLIPMGLALEAPEGMYD